MARTSSGARLTPVTVNGWQQGWVVPAGDPGNITLTFASNSLYRAGLALGLALLPLLAVLALWRRRGSSDRRSAGTYLESGALGGGGGVWPPGC